MAGTFKGICNNMDSICEACGCRYGSHCGEDCPENEFVPNASMEKFYECYVEGTDGGRHYKWYDLSVLANAE